MKKARVLNVEGPKKPGYWDCFKLTLVYEGSDTQIVSYMNRDSYAKFKLEQELLEKGVDAELLEKYAEACADVIRRDCAEEQAGIDL